MAQPEIPAFLDGTIEARDFRHADHVHMAFALLREHTFTDAAHLYSRSLRSIAARAGDAGAYHETITLAFLSLIAERMGGRSDFESFARDNADLLDKRVLERWYSPERLASPLARATFILPEPAR